MTQSVPDTSIWWALRNAGECSSRGGPAHCVDKFDDSRVHPDYIESVAQECLELATEKCKDPLVHVMAMMIISRMVEWHNNCAERQLEDGRSSQLPAGFAMLASSSQWWTQCAISLLVLMTLLHSRVITATKGAYQRLSSLMFFHQS